MSGHVLGNFTGKVNRHEGGVFTTTATSGNAEWALKHCVKILKAWAKSNPVRCTVCYSWAWWPLL